MELTFFNEMCLGNLLWIVEYKLSHFVDITVSNNLSIYAIGNKFLLSQIHKAKEIDSINVHHNACSFKENSTCLFTTSNFHLIGTTSGDLIKINTNDKEQSILFKCRQSTPVTLVIHFFSYTYFLLTIVKKKFFFSEL